MAAVKRRTFVKIYKCAPSGNYYRVARESTAAFQNPCLASSPIAGPAHVHGAQHSRYSWATHQQQRVHFAIRTPGALRSQNGKCPNGRHGGCRVHSVVPKPSLAPPGGSPSGDLFPCSLREEPLLLRTPALRLPAPIAGVANATRNIRLISAAALAGGAGTRLSGQTSAPSETRLFL